MDAGAVVQSDDDEWLDIDAKELVAKPVNLNSVPTPDSLWLAEAESVEQKPPPSWPSIDESNYDFAFEYEQQQQKQGQKKPHDENVRHKLGKAEGYSYASVLCSKNGETAPLASAKEPSYDAAFPPLMPIAQRSLCARQPKRSKRLPKWGEVAFAYD